MAEYAVLLDTLSIQRFVFGSNKLKENLGASYIIENIYDPEVFRGYGAISSSDGSLKGYIGGGNALIFFPDEAKADQCIRGFSTSLLTSRPGVSIACAKMKVEPEDLSDSGRFRTFKNAIFTQLHRNRSQFAPVINLPSLGFTDSCSGSGTPMTVWNEFENKEDQRYVSAETYSKTSFAKDAKTNLLKNYEPILHDKYDFPDDLERLGQVKGEDNHIAVIHIDGNGIGNVVQQIGSLQETTQFSNHLRSAVTSSFGRLLQMILDDLKSSPGIASEYNIDPSKGKTMLPLRPIIMGGDDITFVANGKFGIYFMVKYMEYFNAALQSDPSYKNLSCCGGAAIIKSRYPFYRGYRIAEELCASAKQKRIEQGGNGSWFDFHLLQGGAAGDLETMRQKGYAATRQGNLLLRPFNIAGAVSDFSHMLQFTAELHKGLPNNKKKALREVLAKDITASRHLIAQMATRGITLPSYQSHSFKDTLYFGAPAEAATPFLDALELIELLPDFYLNNAGKGSL